MAENQSQNSIFRILLHPQRKSPRQPVIFRGTLEIAGKPTWWVILYFVPVVSLVISIIVSIAVAEKFGKSTGFGVGLALLGFIFFPILGFGEAKYTGGVAFAPVESSPPPPPPPAPEA